MLTFAYYWYLTETAKAAILGQRPGMTFNTNAKPLYPIIGDIIIVFIVCFTLYTIFGRHAC